MNVEQAKALTAEDFRQRAAAVRPETRMLIGGELVAAQSGKTFETVNPANGEVVALVPLGGDAEVDLAVAAARRTFKSGIWSRMEPRSRMEVLYLSPRRSTSMPSNSPCSTRSMSASRSPI